ncbi:PqiC family protein [Hahella ganghwensis]|uniref:PqiC family protein n=1 Tax=Hahella ganghwensis TaxID=286420 RepID=UPI00036883BE|nr:PqiC family protein [Hahella ganghwensis]
MMIQMEQPPATDSVLHKWAWAGMRSALILLVSGLLISCTLTQPSANSRYYLLSSQPLPSLGSDSDHSRLSENVYVIGPLNFADYLQRSSVVTRVSESEYEVAKLEQWGGKIEDEFQIALLKNLANLKPGSRFVRYPSFVSLPSSVSLQADIMRFDSQLGGISRLEVSWAWIQQNQILASGEFSRSMPAGSNTESAVKAQSALVRAFSEALAERLNSL